MKGLFQRLITNVSDDDLHVFVGFDFKLSVDIRHCSLMGTTLYHRGTDDGVSLLVNNNARHIAPFAVFPYPFIHRL